MSTSSESPSPGGEFTATPPIVKTPTPSSNGALSADDLITLNEEIASMAKAGLPLDYGLALLAKEIGRGRLQQVTQKLADDLRAGCTLPEAFKKQEGRVPSYYAALLAAGIRSNRLTDVLTTLSVYARTISDFRSAVFSAMLYPLIVLVLGFALVVFIGYFVLPTFVQIYADFRMKLPIVTEMLVYVSNHSLELLVIPFCVFLFLLLTERWWLRGTARGRRLWAKFVYSLPGFGVVARSAHLSAFTQLLSILVDQKIPLPEALRLAGETSGDPLIHEGTVAIETDLRQGVPFGAALKKQRLMPELVIWMIGFGERQGTLAESLRQVSEMYRRQAEARAGFLKTILPPMLILILASTLGGLFIFGLMGPLLDLLGGLSGLGGFKK